MSKLVPESHPALHSIAEEVPLPHIATARIQKVIKDMRAALRSYKAEGFTAVAIAAPQIGVSLRIFLVEDATTEEKDALRLPPLVAINPRIIKLSKRKALGHEGCLSVGDSYGTVYRSSRATIRAYDAEGKEYERGASNLLARIFQHEIDHLDGILFLDRVEKIIQKETPAKHKKKPSKTF